MSDRADHYAAADRLLEEARGMTDRDRQQTMLLAAIGHAILATVDLEVYSHIQKAESYMRRQVTDECR